MQIQQTRPGGVAETPAQPDGPPPHPESERAVGHPAKI